MANPRMTTSVEGILEGPLTLEADSTIVYDAATRGTNLRNRAVTMVGSRQCALAADGDRVLGSIDHVEADGRVVVIVDGSVNFIQGDTTVVIGTGIVGMTLSAVRGYIRSAVVPTGSYVQGTATDASRGRGVVLDIADTASIKVWL